MFSELFCSPSHVLPVRWHCEMLWDWDNTHGMCWICLSPSTAELSGLLSCLAWAWVNLGTEWCWWKRRSSFHEQGGCWVSSFVFEMVWGGLPGGLRELSCFFCFPHTETTGKPQQLQWAPQKFSLCLGITSSRLVVQLDSWTCCMPVLYPESYTGHVQENCCGKDLELFRRNWFQMMPCCSFIVFFRQGIK